MMINHARGGSPAVFNFVIKHCGYYGLFALPFVGLTLEKSFYDTAVGWACFQAGVRTPVGFVLTLDKVLFRCLLSR